VTQASRYTPTSTICARSIYCSLCKTTVSGVDPIGVVVRDPSLQLDKNGPSGVGVTLMSAVGLTKANLQMSIVHIRQLIDAVKLRIEYLRVPVHNELRKQIDGGEPLEWAPIARLPDPKRRS